jgi:hypothetical protein
VTGDGPPAWRLGRRLTTPHHKKAVYYEILQGISASSCEHSNKTLGSIKCGEILD